MNQRSSGASRSEEKIDPDATTLASAALMAVSTFGPAVAVEILGGLGIRHLQKRRAFKGKLDRWSAEVEMLRNKIQEIEDFLEDKSSLNEQSLEAASLELNEPDFIIFREHLEDLSQKARNLTKLTSELIERASRSEREEWVERRSIVEDLKPRVVELRANYRGEIRGALDSEDLDGFFEGLQNALDIVEECNQIVRDMIEEPS